MAPPRGRRRVLDERWRRAVVSIAALAVVVIPVAVAVAATSTPLDRGRTGSSPRPANPQPLTQRVASLPDDLDPEPQVSPDTASAAGTSPKGSVIALPVLMYHYIRVAPPGDTLGFHLSVTPDNFRRQMDFLHFAGVHTVTLADAMASLQSGKPLPSRAVVLTFDDGYSDFATAATPVLKRDGLKGTVFVVSGFVGRPGYMNADQLHAVQQAGMVVGCHTVNHLDLAKISPQLAQTEIKVAHQQLQALTGTKVLDFAYPYGGFNASVEQMVLADGFREAVTTQWGTALRLDHRAAWPRLRIDGADSLVSFADKALAGTTPQAVQALVQSFEAQPPGSQSTQNTPAAPPTTTPSPAPASRPV
jgi:peptidoglycan/xylan/chitin deacetylase (PgdA/CDA1 family)